MHMIPIPKEVHVKNSWYVYMVTFFVKHCFMKRTYKQSSTIESPVYKDSDEIRVRAPTGKANAVGTGRLHDTVLTGSASNPITCGPCKGTKWALCEKEIRENYELTGRSLQGEIIMVFSSVWKKRHDLVHTEKSCRYRQNAFFGTSC